MGLTLARQSHLLGLLLLLEQDDLEIWQKKKQMLMKLLQVATSDPSVLVACDDYHNLIVEENQVVSPDQPASLPRQTV